MSRANLLELDTNNLPLLSFYCQHFHIPSIKPNAKRKQSQTLTNFTKNKQIISHNTNWNKSTIDYTDLYLQTNSHILFQTNRIYVSNFIKALKCHVINNIQSNQTSCKELEVDRLLVIICPLSWSRGHS